MDAKMQRPHAFLILLYKFTLNRGFLVRSFSLSTLLFISVIKVAGQKFPTNTIPDSLKENADMVVRLEETSYEIKSTGHVIIHLRSVYTIMNEKGEKYATYRTYYNDKTKLINSVYGYLYDASGREVRHFKKKDMEDHPVWDGSSFVNDERVKVGSLYSHTFPYTVDFEQEIEETELFYIGNWLPQESVTCSVETSSFSVTAPADYVLRYKMINSNLKPVISDEKGIRKTYLWEMRSLRSFEEPSFFNFVSYAPLLMIGLSDVAMGSYKGSMNSWNDFAKFYGSMQSGRDNLPEETKQRVHELVKNLKDPSSKVAVLYTYLQQNTHYVGIQLGIGGWQTYDATYVATKKYGDCKALSNFMIALLKEAGIKGNAVVIRGGEDKGDFITDFTHDPFNHVICCVPLEKDTIWLECTDQFLPPGYLSWFTANRYGLFIDDNGGTLVHTPAYLLKDNIQIRKINAILDNEGNLNLEGTALYRAQCQDRIGDLIHRYSKENQLNFLKSQFNLPTYDVSYFEYKEDFSNRLPVINETLKIAVSNYAQVSGKRIFINPDILTRFSEKLIEEKNRKFDMDLKEEFVYVDSVQILIPAGYEPESKSVDLDLTTKFGKYKNKTTITADKIVYYRRREQFSGRFNAKEYSDYVAFCNSMYDADHSSIVLVKKN